MDLNNKGSLRNDLRVRLLRRPSQAKPTQVRGKKSRLKDEAAQKLPFFYLSRSEILFVFLSMMQQNHI
ncbi:hypothetical protein L1887_34399 [Cichorium endivia]|nr:hypothetical protein L1887_34399 [Cichorium endivia]